MDLVWRHYCSISNVKNKKNKHYTPYTQTILTEKILSSWTFRNSWRWNASSNGSLTILRKVFRQKTKDNSPLSSIPQVEKILLITSCLIQRLKLKAIFDLRPVDFKFSPDRKQNIYKEISCLKFKLNGVSGCKLAKITATLVSMYFVLAQIAR